MRKCILNFALTSFICLCFFSINISRISCELFPPLQGLACALPICGEGTCSASNTSVFGYQCECYKNWKQFSFGNLTSCVLPNCTINLGCDNGGPSPPIPPIQPPNPANPCGGIWCGDGSCVVNGTGNGYYCQCNDGSANLLDNANFACFKQCSFGADCTNLGIGPPSPPPPDTSSGSPKTGMPSRQSPPPPPSNSFGSPKSGSNGGSSNSFKNFRVPIILVLSSIFLTWI